MSASKRRAPYGFTLVELLTVIFIIALLISILVPALNAVRTQARNAKTSGELSSIGKGVELFHGVPQELPHSGIEGAKRHVPKEPVREDPKQEPQAVGPGDRRAASM